MYRSVIDRVFFRLLLTSSVATNLRWRAAALVALSLGTSMAASAQRAPFARVDSSQVIHFLNQTIDWYRHRTAEQQLATEPDDVLVLNDNRQLADQVVRLAFEFAQAEAESLGNSDAAGHNQDTSASPSQYQALLQLETKITQQAQESQTEVDDSPPEA